MLASLIIEREKFYPEPGIEPESPALRAGTLTTELSMTELISYSNPLFALGTDNLCRVTVFKLW